MALTRLIVKLKAMQVGVGLGLCYFVLYFSASAFFCFSTASTDRPLMVQQYTPSHWHCISLPCIDGFSQLFHSPLNSTQNELIISLKIWNLKHVAAQPREILVFSISKWRHVHVAYRLPTEGTCKHWTAGHPYQENGGAGHFGHKTLRHRDTSASQNWCRSLSRITSGAVSHRNCPGSKCPAFPRSRHSCRSVSYHVFGVKVSWDRCRSVPECLDAEVSCGRSVR